MKQKVYVYLSILSFILSTAIFVYTLSLVGLFTKNKLLVKAQACDHCADYKIFLGSFKLSRELPDTLKQSDVSQVFVSGMTNPYSVDFTKTYDYYLLTGSVEGIRQVPGKDPWIPVLHASRWEHITLRAGWPLGILGLFFLILARYFYRRFINANKESVLESSIKAHFFEEEE